MKYHERNVAYGKFIEESKHNINGFSEAIKEPGLSLFVDIAFTNGIELGESSANSYHEKLYDKELLEKNVKCEWIKLGQYYCQTGCGLKVVTVREEIKENIYCRKCGKKIKVI